MASFDLTSITDLRPATNGNGAIADVTQTISTNALAASTLASPTKYVVFESTQALRVRWDGVSPTSTVGHLITANKAYLWTVAQWNGSKLIRDSTSSGDGALIASPFTT